MGLIIIKLIDMGNPMKYFRESSESRKSGRIGSHSIYGEGGLSKAQDGIKKNSQAQTDIGSGESGIDTSNIFYPTYVLKSRDVNKAKSEFDAGFGIDGLGHSGISSRIPYKMGDMYRDKLEGMSSEAVKRDSTLRQEYYNNLYK